MAHSRAAIREVSPDVIREVSLEVIRADIRAGTA